MGDPLGRLLLATEGGEFDAGAQALALALAARARTRLGVVLPVTTNPEYETVAPELAARAEAGAAGRVDALGAAARAAGVQIDLHLRRGPEAWREIVDDAVERAADVIVIRRRGQRGLLANLMIGEMVGKVLAHAPCDLLICPRGTGLWQSAVLLGLAPDEPDPVAIRRATALAALAGQPLRVVAAAARESAIAHAQAMVDTAVAQALALALTTAVSGEVLTGKPHEVLIEAARTLPAGLVVVGRHAGERLARTWAGSVSERVIGQVSCPVWVRVAPPDPVRRP